MRLIDADTFADVLIDVVKSKNYESLALDKALTAADCLNAIVAELKGTGIDGFKNCPTVDLVSRVAVSDHIKNRLIQTAMNNMDEITSYAEVCEDIVDNRLDTWIAEVKSYTDGISV